MCVLHVYALVPKAYFIMNSCFNLLCFISHLNTLVTYFCPQLFYSWFLLCQVPLDKIFLVCITTLIDML